MLIVQEDVSPPEATDIAALADAVIMMFFLLVAVPGLLPDIAEDDDGDDVFDILDRMDDRPSFLSPARPILIVDFHSSTFL